MIYFWLVAHPGAKNVNEKFLLAIKIQVIKFRISVFFMKTCDEQLNYPKYFSMIILELCLKFLLAIKIHIEQDRRYFYPMLQLEL